MGRAATTLREQVPRSGPCRRSPCGQAVPRTSIVRREADAWEPSFSRPRGRLIAAGTEGSTTRRPTRTVARPMPPLRRPPSGRPVAFVPAVLGGSVALVGVFVALSATEPSPFTSRGVPGALGVMVAVIVALLAGPSRRRGRAGRRSSRSWSPTPAGGFVAAGVWALSALLSGMIADRFRAAGRERDVAHAAERHARQAAESESERLSNLQALTVAATASTVLEVGMRSSTRSPAPSARPRRGSRGCPPTVASS